MIILYLFSPNKYGSTKKQKTPAKKLNQDYVFTQCFNKD